MTSIWDVLNTFVTNNTPCIKLSCDHGSPYFMIQPQYLFKSVIIRMRKKAY